MNDDEITYWLELCNIISENVEDAIAIAREDPALTSITKVDLGKWKLVICPSIALNL